MTGGIRKERGDRVLVFPTSFVPEIEPAEAPSARKRGICYDLYPTHRVYKAICSDGSVLASVHVPQDRESEWLEPVVCGLADMLDELDPSPDGNGPAPLLVVR